MDQNDLAKTSSLFYLKELKRGDYFIKLGHYANELRFYKSGMLRVFATDGQKEVTQWIATLGYFLTGFRSLIFDETAKWNM